MVYNEAAWFYYHFDSNTTDICYQSDHFIIIIMLSSQHSTITRCFLCSQRYHKPCIVDIWPEPPPAVHKSRHMVSRAVEHLRDLCRLETFSLNMTGDIWMYFHGWQEKCQKFEISLNITISRSGEMTSLSLVQDIHWPVVLKTQNWVYSRPRLNTSTSLLHSAQEQT